LRIIAPERAQLTFLLSGPDALGDHRKSKVSGQRDHRFDDPGICERS
jgi:hypothetical protein